MVEEKNIRRGKRRRPVEVSSADAEIPSTWVPKTKLGKMVMEGKIKSLDEIFTGKMKIMEPEIVDSLTGLQEKTVDTAKTARVVRAGRKFAFRVAVLVGNKNGYIGLGLGKDKERLSALRKASRKARLNLVKVKSGCGSWECTCGTNHSIPFKVQGECSSVKVKLMPAPKGVGLVVGDKIKDVLTFAGIRDVWGKTKGDSRTSLNYVTAAIDALSKTTKFKVSSDIEKLEK
ncbi:MAG: 30S ribosomal protein S5 [Candidatus Diapherotrites archaeon CG08_land_8_20_14_0_20_34_12]|nr:MAG: 30S ribosomal protein S5 [Candidatus Diapherotrites archaeon CG08_land_8_20_14_0_20_34_12]